MATHSSILAWRIPWKEEPSGLWDSKESDTTEQLTLTHLPRACATRGGGHGFLKVGVESQSLCPAEEPSLWLKSRPTTASWPGLSTEHLELV